MNISQKSCLTITFLCCVITAVLAFSFWDAPYSNIFITEVTAIICAEVLLGAEMFVCMAKKDSTMVHTAGYWITPFLYLLFTLIMIPVACSDITFKKFFALHITGFIAALIFLISYKSSEHYIDVQSDSDGRIRNSKKQLRNKMQKIAAVAAAVFPANKGAINETTKLSEAIRFFRDPDESLTEEMEQINVLLDELSFALQSKDIDLFQRKIGELKTTIRLYENKA